MTGPNIKPGSEADKDEVAEMCQQMFEGIRAMLHVLNPYRDEERTKVGKAIQTRKQVNAFIMKQGSQGGSLTGRVLSLGSEEFGVSVDDLMLLECYYDILNSLYTLYADRNMEVQALGTTAQEDEESMREWVDSTEQLPYSTWELENVKNPETGKYSYRRRIIHQAIIDNMSENGETVADEYIPCALILVGGLSPAVYQFSDALQQRFGDFIQVDAEQITAQIPECQRALEFERMGPKQIRSSRNAASIVGDEVADLMQVLLQQALERRSNLLVGGYGEDLDALSELVSRLRADKYRVQLIMIDQSESVTVDRMRRHAERTGFGASEERIKARHQAIDANFSKCIELTPTVMIYNNNGEMPELVWVKQGKKSKAYQESYIEKRGWKLA